MITDKNTKKAVINLFNHLKYNMFQFVIKNDGKGIVKTLEFVDNDKLFYQVYHSVTKHRMTTADSVVFEFDADYMLIGYQLPNDVIQLEGERNKEYDNTCCP